LGREDFVHTLEDVPEIEIIRDLANDSTEQKMFLLLLSAYEERIARRVFTRVKRTDVSAEDCVQEAFFAIWKQRKTMSSTTCVRAYMFRVAFNEVNNALTRRYRLEAMTARQAAQLDSFEEQQSPDLLASSEIWDRLDRAMHDHLTEPEREALSLFHYAELTYEEIAESTGFSLQAVKGQIFRARKKLRSHLGEQFHNLLSD
jgi:RNA polymerase sigma-70 factor, ECF subfamily